MPKIAQGVKLLVVKADGTVLDSIELGGYNLDHRFAGVSLCDEIKASLTPSCYAGFTTYKVFDDKTLNVRGNRLLLGTFESEGAAAEFIDTLDPEKRDRGDYSIEPNVEE